ncbi:MAG: hypothetical protein GEU91_20060 [Rhizobiales bacterium]|nr:hypothetical protein [Hyphomicrobiales bacterium]
MTTLRQYQHDIVGEFEATVASGTRRVIVVAATGAGKTIVAGEIMRRAVAAGQRVLFLSHRVEITKQTSAKLLDVDISHGILQAGFATELDAPVQVASVQTLHGRGIRRSTIELPPADLLIVDECHHATAATYKKIIEAYPGAALLGLTATPCRGDGRGLGGIFETLIECPQVPELIEGKFLVGTRVYAPSQPDLKGVKVQAGDYVESQLAERMDVPQLVGDIPTHWHRHAEGRRTVVFATGVQHSVHIRDEFRKSGVACDHLDGSTPKDEREAILQKLACGAIDVVSNCAILTEGFDCPDIGCIVLARPTRKMGLFRQMIGRGLRPAESKVDCIIIDHAGAVHRHGFAEDRVEWTLDPDKPAKNPTHTKRTEGDIRSRLVDCKQCGALRTGGEACRHCGFLPSPRPRHVGTVDADLALLQRNGRTVGHYLGPADRERWHRQLAYIAVERGYKSGWAAHKFKEKFGQWPSARFVQPMTPTPEVRSWVRSRQIAFAKARQKAAAADAAA